MHTMTKLNVRPELIDVKGLLREDGDCLRTMAETIVQATLEAEKAASIGAEKGERTTERLGYRSGHYSRSSITCVGTPS
jgi:putative transposase